MAKFHFKQFTAWNKDIKKTEFHLASMESNQERIFETGVSFSNHNQLNPNLRSFLIEYRDGVFLVDTVEVEYDDLENDLTSYIIAKNRYAEQLVKGGLMIKYQRSLERRKELHAEVYVPGSKKGRKISQFRRELLDQIKKFGHTYLTFEAAEIEWPKAVQVRNWASQNSLSCETLIIPMNGEQISIFVLRVK